MRKRNLLLGILFLLVLIATHWFVFYLGQQRGTAEWHALRDQAVAHGELYHLRSNVSILRVMAEHPARFTEPDFRGARITGEQALSGGEKIALRYLKKTGDEAGAEEVESLLREGRELLPKLPK